MSIAPSRHLTPADLLCMPDEKNFELVNGELVEKNVSTLSSWVEGRVYLLVGNFCEHQNRGHAWPGTLGYQCFPDDPDKVRKPDVSFIRVDRWSPSLYDEGYCSIHPDLAAEVVSPGDLAYELEIKVEEYLRAGVRLVWVIHPETRTVQIFRADGSTTKVREDQEISGEDVLDGFRCKVADFFPPKTA